MSIPSNGATGPPFLDEDDADGGRDSFGATLRRYRLRSGHTQNSLAKVVQVNASYINRMETGERSAPTREIALALARGMELSAYESDRLVASAGLLPPGLQKLGPGDSTVAAVIGLLTNDRLSPEARADFRAVVETMAIRWQSMYQWRAEKPVPPPEPLPEKRQPRGAVPQHNNGLALRGNEVKR